jgi:hypothetical protein
MGFAPVRGTGLTARLAGWPPRQPAREGRRLPMQGTSGLIEVVFEAVDPLLQPVALLPVPIPILVRSLVFPAQALDFPALPFDFALLPFELIDQLVARHRAPPRSHTRVMPRLDRWYKWESRRSRRSGTRSVVMTR